MRRFSFCLLQLSLFGLIVSVVSAEPQIQRYLSRIERLRFILQSEATHASEVGGLPLTAVYFEEAVLQNISDWRIQEQGSGSYRLRVFELMDPLGSFMIYSHWPKPEGSQDLAEIPVGHAFSPAQSLFWRGNFFFVLRPETPSNLGKETFIRLTERFVQGISVENLLPVSITHLPEENQVEDSIRFYLGAGSLADNPRFPEPLLEEIGFSDRIEIAYSLYRPGDDALFLIGYPTPKLADEYSIRLQDRLQSFFSKEGIYMKRSGVLICLYVGPEQQAQQVLPAVKYAPEIKWLYEKKDEGPPEELMTFFGLLTKTFLGIGVFLLLIMGAGLSVGLIRYELLQRFPSLYRKKEMVRLNLE